MSYLTSELFVPPVGVTMDCLVDFTSQPETVDPVKPVLCTGEEKYNLFCQDSIPAKKATLCFLGILESISCPNQKAHPNDSLLEAQSDSKQFG